jgi:hypothetical protein
VWSRGGVLHRINSKTIPSKSVTWGINLDSFCFNTLCIIHLLWLMNAKRLRVVLSINICDPEEEHYIGSIPKQYPPNPWHGVLLRIHSVLIPCVLSICYDLWMRIDCELFYLLTCVIQRRSITSDQFQNNTLRIHDMGYYFGFILFWYHVYYQSVIIFGYSPIMFFVIDTYT